MNKIKYLLVLVAVMMLSACQDWLDVKPNSEVDQVDLFSSEDGYLDALNGVYLMLGENSLYGDNLVLSFTDVLAQNYFIPTGHNYIDLAFHNYETEFGESIIAGAWNKAYNVIANCNNIIEHLQNDNESKFAGNNYQYIMGEALAIRALLHFDMVRLFNVPYTSNSDFIGIPYVDEYEIALTEQSTTSEALELVLRDLKLAYEILQDDEIMQEEQNEGVYRENRLNYYAVAGLLARVYLYQQDYINAAFYSQEVIDAGRFNWMIPAEVIGENDYLFYPEVLFGLYQNKLGETAEGYFKHIETNNPNELICADRSVDWYDGDDIRFKYWFEIVSTMEGDKRFMKKYNRPTAEEDQATYQDPILPIVKLSEMYLILAECKAQTDLVEGVTVLNEMLAERRAIELDLAADELMFSEAIAREYEREFYGEGQLFYFYKRMNYPSIVGMDGSDVQMSDAKYTLPLPAAEVEYGGRVTE